MMQGFDYFVHLRYPYPFARGTFVLWYSYSFIMC